MALPIIWFVSLPLPRQWQNLWLLLTSIIVYAWGGVGYTTILLGSILFNYGIGRMLHRPEGRWWLAVGIVGNLGTLAYFKYAMFALG